MNRLLLQAGWIFFLIILITYVWYCLCLAMVLRKLQSPWWKAFVPGYNFMALMEALGLPGRWIFYALVPYVGFAYSLATAERLGRAFNKSFAYSATWLTVGAFIGMAHLGFSSQMPDLAIKDRPVPSVTNLKKMRGRKQALNRTDSSAN